MERVGVHFFKTKSDISRRFWVKGPPPPTLAETKWPKNCVTQNNPRPPLPWDKLILPVFFQTQEEGGEGGTTIKRRLQMGVSLVEKMLSFATGASRSRRLHSLPPVEKITQNNKESIFVRHAGRVLCRARVMYYPGCSVGGGVTFWGFFFPVGPVGVYSRE